MKRLNESGSHLVIAAVGVLVLGVIAFAGYTVMNRQADTDSTTAATSSTEIKNTADLNDTVKQLDDSSSQVDSNLDDSALDADLNDML